MQHKAKRRRKEREVEGPAKGIRVSADLMGPFEADLGGYIHSLMVVDDDY